MARTKIAVGLSGGVDSSVSAFLLKEQGFDVIGIFMKNWEEEDETEFCPAEQDAKDAQAVAALLDIPFYTINFAEEYWERVFTYFLAEYRAYRTPNPDVLCNKEIKFKAFLDYAKTLQADYIATGHYAKRIVTDQGIALHKAADRNKDQTYFLALLTQQQLALALFPLGELTKSEVRAIAHQQGFPNHAKKDSTGICFIGEKRFKAFLSRYLPAQPGDIVTEQGQVLSQHDGLMYYTLGQRKGLRLGGSRLGIEAPWYVANKDVTHNRLIVVQDPDHPLLLCTAIQVIDLSWIQGHAPALSFQCQAKIRYRQTDQACTVFINGNQAQVKFDQPQRAATPGQTIVFYQNDECLGGGTIL